MNSVLLLHKEADDAALDAALALLDDCAPPPASPAATPAPAPAPAVASAPAPLKRCRKRQYTELKELRSLVAELQERLAQLQRFCKRGALAKGVAHDSPLDDAANRTATASVWFERAVAEYKKLERAKRWNLKLHHELASQREAYKTLQQLFRLQLSPQDMALLAEMEHQRAAGNSTAEDDALRAAFMELLLHLERMHAHTPAIVAEIGLRNTHSMFHTSHNEYDAVYGRSFEFTISSPMPHSVAALGDFVWEQATTNAHFECSTPSHQHMTGSQVPQDMCIGKRFNLVFSKALGSQRMDGLVAIRRFVTPDDVVIALTTRLVFPGTPLVLRHEGRVIVRAFTGTDGSCSLVQSRFRVYRERNEDAGSSANKPLSRALSQVQNFVVGFTGNMIEAYQLRIHEALRHTDELAFSAARHRDLCIGCMACSMQASSQQLVV